MNTERLRDWLAGFVEAAERLGLPLATSMTATESSADRPDEWRPATFWKDRR